MVTVPAAVQSKAKALGAEQWLSDLPQLLRELEQRWQLTIGSFYEDATEALVAEATLEDGTLAVVKVLVPRGAGARSAYRAEATALRLADGNGCVRLLADDEEHGALLVERLGPSLYDLRLPIEVRHEILCTTALELWRPAPDSGLMTGAEKGAWLIDYITTQWEALDRPCSEASVDHAIECANRRITAHDDERAVLVHGDVHQWNVLRATDPGAGRPSGRPSYKLVDPDGLLAEPAYDLGIIMREDPTELLASDPLERAHWLSARCAVDATAIWEWGVVERVSTGLLSEVIGLQPVGCEMLRTADRVAGMYLD